MAIVPLHEFIAAHREEIIRRCAANVRLRSMLAPDDQAIRHGVPLFLDQLCDNLRLGETSTTEIEKSAVLHGHERLLQGFTVSQVVQVYGDVCQSVTGVALEKEASIGTDDFRILNLCLDYAIAGAVTQYGLVRQQSSVHSEFVHGSERLGFLAHQTRTFVETAMLAFDALANGQVGIAGSTGAVLKASLEHLHALMDRSLAEARGPQPVVTHEPFLVAALINQLVPAAMLAAESKGHTLAIMDVDRSLSVAADRDVLAAVVGNLLENACKFTAPRSNVTLRVVASDERVLIEIADECFGLPDAGVTPLFPLFKELPIDGSHGIGLAFSRWGVEASGGRIYARNLPDKGCVFTVDLPRVGSMKTTVAA